MNWNRILSGLVCVVYGLIAFSNGGALGLLMTIGLIIFPIGFIWYADEIGGYTGSTFSGYITNSSPTGIIRILGWLFLLSPIAIVIISKKYFK
jgi:hypothetical protein